MSSLRDLVSGSDGCTEDNGAGPSNPLSSLVDTLLGSSKQQELEGSPSILPQPGFYSTHQGLGGLTTDDFGTLSSQGVPLPIPGLGPQTEVEANVAAFLESQRAAGRNEDRLFEEVYHGKAPLAATGPGRRLDVLHSAFASFLRSGASPWSGPALPDVGLSVQEQCHVRDRTTIMARHVFADRGDVYADAQVSSLLASLHIDPAALPAEAEHRSATWEGIWGSQQPPEPAVAETAAADGSAAAAGAVLPSFPPDAWAEEFAGEADRGLSVEPQSASEWIGEFVSGPSWAQEFASGASTGQGQTAREVEAEPIASRRELSGAAWHSKQLAETLAADQDPKFQNSKFLQFVSKMSRGELVVEDNKVVERTPQEVGSAWAGEFSGDQQHRDMEEAWKGAVPTPAAWADEFAGGGEQSYFDAWVEQFANEGGLQPNAFADDWLEEYQNQLSHLSLDDGGGAVAAEPYTFAEDNPFLGEADPLATGKQLFRTGVLSEAALALEAALQRDPSCVEAWRLLGTVHAENDDDKKAINAMMEAMSAGPEDREVMLSLGVSHTNELNQSQAVGHLSSWLATHPRHAEAAAAAFGPHGGRESLQATIGAFDAALRAAPDDVEVASALGVLHNLARDFDAAVAAFRRALEIRPGDYSLWNKLGATLANSSRSGEAISAYRRALELKPNYMRAWTNMGISYANLGDHLESARFYVKALELNPEAGSVWSYLRTSLLCAGRSDLIEAVRRSDLAALRDGLAASPGSA